VFGATVGVGVDGAAAARPAKGALYADWFNSPDVTLDLRVSRSGRQLDPRRSVWAYEPASCDTFFYVRLGSRRRPVRIKRGGRFRFVRRQGRFVFRMRGQFVTKDRAEVKLRYRREPVRGGQPRACEVPSQRFVPRRVGIPFRDCRTHEAKPLLWAPTGRVFQQFRRASYLIFDGSEFPGGWRPVAYACLYGVNRLVKLGEDIDNGDPGGTVDLVFFRLVGPYVAYGTYGGVEFARSDVVVHDLRTGGKREQFAGGFISDLVLKSNGATAWTAWEEGEPNAVWAWDSLGNRRLDSGNIALESLELNGSTLTWVKDGVVRSATLY
jgi:hypothetical protein